MALLTDIIDLATDYCDFSCIYSDCEYCFLANSDNCPCDADYGYDSSCPCDDCVMQIIKKGSE